MRFLAPTRVWIDFSAITGTGRSVPCRTTVGAITFSASASTAMCTRHATAASVISPPDDRCDFSWFGPDVMSLSFWKWCENFHFCQVFCVANRGAFEPPPFRGFGEDIYGRRIVFSGLWLKPDVLHIGGNSSALKQKGHKLQMGFAVNQKSTLFFAEHDFSPWGVKGCLGRAL